MTTEEEVNDFLEHFGVPGMKWGKRKAANISTNRSLNKASRSVDRAAGKASRKAATAKNDAAIDKARSNIKSGKSAKDLGRAKDKYQKEKTALGSREAKKALNKVRDKNFNDYQLSQTAKSGRETTKAVLFEIGKAVLVGAATRA